MRVEWMLALTATDGVWWMSWPGCWRIVPATRPGLLSSGASAARFNGWPLPRSGAGCSPSSCGRVRC